MNVISLKLAQRGDNSHHSTVKDCKAASSRALPSPPDWGGGARGCARVKAADGCKADWTCAKRAPARGEPPRGWRRIDMGCRCTEKVESIAADGTATTTLHQLYLYRGYLQIACCDLMESGNPCRWFLTWDPTQSPRGLGGGLDNGAAVAPEGRAANGVAASQPTATRPLAIRKDGTWYAYGWDLTKNICEVFGSDGYIKTTYSYSPYGAVTAAGNVTQPIQWSSEYHDTELALVYYNYRHYNPAEGRWIGRDVLPDVSMMNLYSYVSNSSTAHEDYLGLYDFPCDEKHIGWYKNISVSLYAIFQTGEPVQVANTDGITGIVGDIIQDKLVDKVLYKLENSSFYQNLQKITKWEGDLKTAFEKFEILVVSGAVSSGGILLGFELLAEADFCCRKDDDTCFFRHASFKNKVSKTQNPKPVTFKFNYEGSRSNLSYHVDSLPNIFAEVAQGLKSKSCR